MRRNGFWTLALALLFSAGARADMVTLEFNVSFGDTPADGGAPWVVATLASGADAPDVVPGNVLLTVTASPLLGEADVTALYFNFSGAPDSLTFVPVNTAAVSGYTILQEAQNAYRADGDGKYDIRIDLPTANTPAGARLSAGESISFVIRGAGTLAASDFFLLSAPGPGEGNPGPFFAAAHIQSTGPYPFDGSDWVAAVPIPAAVWLFASALGMLGFAMRRRRASFEPA